MILSAVNILGGQEAPSTGGPVDGRYVLKAGDTMTGNLVFSDGGEGVTLSGGGSILGTSGSVDIAASGTNQNITLTPSGTGQLIFPRGSAAKPSFAESSASTTGFYFNNDGTIRVSTGGIAAGYFARNSVGGGLVLTGVGTDSKVYVSNGLTVALPFVTTPSALTYASPTSVDVTLASCFTVTTVNATGSVTFNATAGGTAGQEMTILITNDATSAKTITFGTNFKSTGTLTPSAASRQTTISFRSDGVNFLETGRAVLSS